MVNNKSRWRASPALVVSILALVVSLGGTAFASGMLPRHSVGNAQLRADAVTTGKVADHTLLRRDFRTGQVPSGPQGPQGDRGDAGSALGWATILGTGTIYTSGGSLAAPTVTHIATGTYCIGGPGWVGQGAPYSLTRIGDDAGYIDLNPEFFGSACNAVPNTIVVYNLNAAGVLADAYAFTIARLD